MESALFTQSGEPESVWTFEDLAMFLAAILPSLLLSSLVLRLLLALAPFAAVAPAVQQLTYQCALYGFLMCVLCATALFRHQESPLAALGWRQRFRGVWWCVLGAPVLAIGNAVLGVALRAPAVPNPAERLMDGQASRVMVAVFVVLLGPAFEEFVFRGFLQPLLRRKIGAWPAVFAAAVPFSLLHGQQNLWAWQALLLIWFAGSVFGAVRQSTGSTAASILLHSSYNLTLFTAFLAGQR